MPCGGGGVEEFLEEGARGEADADAEFGLGGGAAEGELGEGDEEGGEGGEGG